MLKNRIIPTLLMKNMGLVKDVSFKSERRLGSILPQIKIYNLRQVDELIILDVAATVEKNKIDYNEISELAKYNFVPLTIGGGIKELDQIERLLSLGADKISVNSISYKNKKFVKDAVGDFGSQCIVGSIDYRLVNNKRICFSHSGRKSQNKDLIEWAIELEELGVGELLITCIDLDGKMKGYDVDILNEITKIINIPIIFSGGASCYNDMYLCFKAGSDAVAAASIFHFTELTPLAAKKFLTNKNIPVRL